ncbi:MAG: hypothetical protein FJZ15_02610 [Candidatus Omnitrophica bacterium]|nr:hypothetical protein [Candidatus Omnitrophota bacterium]
MNKHYKGAERRAFARLNYTTPLNCKVCNKQTISCLLNGYVSNISPAGLLCNIKERVKKNDVLWLSFDRGTLSFCEDLEKRSFIYQSGVIAKVARIERKSDGSYDVGVHFITREEKNSTNIFPQTRFLDKNNNGIAEAEDTAEEEITVEVEDTELEGQTREEPQEDNG